jgi:hypothetical protein
MPAGAVPAREGAQVAQLIANGKSALAVDIAKEVHKRLGSEASEALLLDAYAARIRSLAERNLVAEAKALLDLVHGRYTSARTRLREFTDAGGVRRDELAKLVTPLADPSLAPEQRAGIEKAVRATVTDLAALAACEALPAHHALRMAANALARAFAAVTTGPVAEEALALAEVSRQSPLAPWKMLVRAIAAFYRGDDALSLKYADAVDPGAAAARLVPALRALAGQKPALTASAAALVDQVTGAAASLRAAFQKVDQAFARNNAAQALSEIRNAVALCQTARPALLERLRQHISVRAMLAGIKADRVTTAMGAPSLKDANFWRLLARANEEKSAEPPAIPYACSLWEEFRKHALREGWFAANSPEMAALYLHMADLLHRLPDDEAYWILSQFDRTFKGHSEYYQGQPPEIRALAPPPGRQDRYYLRMESLFERACDADPCAANFERWLRWTAQHQNRSSDLVAQRWRAAFPKDLAPLLHLMQSAEKANALKRAFKLMEEAEAVDGLNPDVRKARLRLLVSMAIRHLQQKKPHLAEAELRDIEALPQAQQGDRPAFLLALRWVWWTLRESEREASAVRAEAARSLGGAVAAEILLAGVARACRLRQAVPRAEDSSKRTPGVSVAAAVGRACALGEDMGVRLELPADLSARLHRELSAKDPAADVPALRALAEVALRADDSVLAYAASAAGLTHAPAHHAEFLFLRARALPTWLEQRREDCVAAASELARRHRNHDLLERIGRWRDEEFLLMERSEAAVGDERISRVLREEKQQRQYPRGTPRRRTRGQCNCPECRAERAGFAPQMPAELQEMLDEFGPEAVAKAMAEVFFEGGNSKRGRRSRRGGGDFPL